VEAACEEVCLPPGTYRRDGVDANGGHDDADSEFGAMRRRPILEPAFQLVPTAAVPLWRSVQRECRRMPMQRGLALQPVAEQLPVGGDIRSPGARSLKQIKPANVFATVA
jgi:hypothetical protein